MQQLASLRTTVLKQGVLMSPLMLLLVVAYSEAALSQVDAGSLNLNAAQQQAALSQAQVQLEEEQSEDITFQEIDEAASEPGSTSDQLSKFTFSSPESIEMGNNHRIEVLQAKQLLQAANASGEVSSSILRSGFGRKLKCGSSVKCNKYSKYRTADGSCNNLAHPSWGNASIPMRRWLSPAYDDGISSPRERATQWSSKLPSARLVSTTVHTPSTDADLDDSFTSMLMQWGQFLDHDLTSTPTQQQPSGPYGSSTGCCGFGFRRGHRGIPVPASIRPQCFPIVIPQPDRHFKSRCMNFVRSVQVANADCQAVPVEQLNQITAYVDASNVYGSSQAEQNTLRTFVDGKLLLRSPYLPSDPEPSCTTPNRPSYCFLAGDHRVNENPTLQSMHTIFAREHNRIATQLKRLNCHWKDEKLFQEARKIVGAITQKITYGEYLPIIMGTQEMAKYGLSIGSGSTYENVYSTTTDASIRNAFATAAFRMGHSMIRSFFSSYSKSHSYLGQDQLSKIFGNTSLILNVNNRDVGHYCRGLVKDSVQNTDHKLTQEVTDKLFIDATGDSLDLAALNIQRGRDHGLPSYTKWREFCHLPKVTSFKGLASTTHTAAAAKRLKNVYKHIHDIDLFPGALSETPVPGGLLGPTFTCLLGKQFQALKKGDRFWFEENNAYVKFTQNQLKELRKASLSRVVCDNTDTSKIQTNAFIKASPVSCGSLDAIDLKHWKEAITPTWGPWSSWGACNYNRQSRKRSCKPCGCTGQRYQSRSCGCSWSNWGPWSSCVAGSKSRSRYCRSSISRGRRQAELQQLTPVDASINVPVLYVPCTCPGSGKQIASCGWYGAVSSVQLARPANA